MNALQINCYCNEEQMQIIIDRVLDFISIHDIKDIPDFDNTVEGVRVCVDFDCLLGKLSIRERYFDVFDNEIGRNRRIKQLGAEILDTDWDTLYEDTAVFSSRLKVELEKLNIENEKRNRKALEIAQDERQGLLNPHS